MRKKLLLFVFLLPLILFGQMTPEKISIGKAPAIIYKPSGFDPTKKYSVWIFLHGLGEMAKDRSEIDRLLANGNHTALLNAAEKNKFIVIAPQLVQSYNDWIPGWTNKYLQPVYDYIINNPFTDLTHIVVTGLSLGGGGTNVAMTGPFAPYVSAAIPICATPQYDQDYSVVARYNIPVWAFVAKDDVSFYTAQINTISAINKFSPTPEPKSTVYNSGGHSVWGTVYSTAELYTWALSQNNSPGPVVLPPVIPIDSILTNYRLTIYKSGKVEIVKQ